MPSSTEKQRVAAAIAEHEPEKLYARNKGLKKMTRRQLHEFAKKPIKKSRAKKSAHRR